MTDITILIPAYNEKDSIVELFTRIDAACISAGLTYSILFMDAQSTDGSYAFAQSLTSRFAVEVHQAKSFGKAHVLIEGLHFVQTDSVIMIDADLQYPPEAIPEMVKKSQYDNVIVARRLHYNENYVRKFFTFMHRFFMSRLLFGLTCDVQSGLKLFPRDIIEYLDVSYISPWTFDLALLYTAQKLGYTIGEVSIVFEERKAGISKVSIIGSIYEHSLSSLKFKFFPPLIRKKR